MCPTKLKLTFSSIVLAAGILAATTQTARTQQSNGPDAPVKLQSSTPGTAQVGHLNIGGTAKAAYFKGNGLGVTGINANNVAVGILADARISSNIPRLNQSNAFTGPALAVLGKLGVGGYSSASDSLTVYGPGISIVNDSNLNEVTIQRNNEGGYVATGDDGEPVTYMGAVNNGNRGMVAINAAGLQPAAMMYIDGFGKGVISGDIKNFVVPNPRNDAEDIVYASIEGPEAAAYLRGTIRLVNGHARVNLPQHFQDVTVREGLTVQLTAGSRTSEGLAVEGRTNSGFDIYELHNGHGTYDVDWEVKAVRREHEDYRPVRKWDEALPASNLGKQSQWNARVRSIREREASYASRRLSRP